MHKTLSKKDLPGLIQRLMSQATVYAPLPREDYTEFQSVGDPEQVRWDYGINTRYPPKALFLPQSEVMFRVGGARFESTADEVGARVIWGMRPCDARALQLLDAVFVSEDAVDPYWAEKRERTTIVALGCHVPCDTCFCSTVHSGPFDERGADVLLTAVDDLLVAELLSDKGQALLGHLPDASRDQVAAAEKARSDAQDRMEAPFDPTGVTEKLYRTFDSDFWSEIQQSCLGCGVCTFLCPTCYCFDIVDEALRGERVRNWDTCMLRIYSLEASGHNPRPTNVERTRQRIMHKYAYFVERYDEIGCTGCGRCVRYCPVALDIRQIVRGAQAWQQPEKE